MEGMIRLTVPDDAPALLTLQQRLDHQSSFMLFEPGERDPDPGPLRHRLAAQGNRGSFDLVAEAPHGPSGGPAELVGWLSVAVTPYRRVAHVGSLALGVDAAHASRGLGSALLESSRAEAARRGLRRLELTVMADNLRALNLYLRHGYQVEGLRRGSLVRQDRCIDEYLMAQLLEH